MVFAIVLELRGSVASKLTKLHCFAPCGAAAVFPKTPTACAVGCILSPLGGFSSERSNPDRAEPQIRTLPSCASSARIKPTAQAVGVQTRKITSPGGAQEKQAAKLLADLIPHLQSRPMNRDSGVQCTSRAMACSRGCGSLVSWSFSRNPAAPSFTSFSSLR